MRCSPESNKKRSDGVRRAWAEGRMQLAQAHMKGIPKSVEARAKMSAAARLPGHKNPFVKGHHITPKGVHRSPDTEFKRGDPRIPPLAREGRMKQIFPKKFTKIEILMQDALRIKGIEFETNKALLGMCQPDVVIADKRVVVFCDGDYWHNRLDYVERDARQNEALKEAGWTVLRFWEHEIKADVNSCAAKVLEVVSSNS